MWPGARTVRSDVDTAVPVPTTAAEPLLGRVRQLFLVLAALLLVVEGVELLDADTVLWPDRAVAALGILTAAAVLLVVRARAHVPRWCDVVWVATIVAVGWGLGRIGAVLAMLLGLALLRTLYGSRRSVALAVGGMLLGYATVGMLLDGPAGLLDLGYVVVWGGLAAFGVVIRQVAEAVARHDVGATWDRVLGAAAHRLLEASNPAVIDRCLEEVVVELDRHGPAAARGLLAVPAAADVDPVAAPTPPDGAGQLAADLHGRMGRLWTDAQIARSLLASEQRYRRLAEDSRDGIYLRSASNTTAFPYVNAAGRRLLGALDKPGAPGIDLGRVHREDRHRLVDELLAHPYVRTPVRVRLLDDGVPAGVRWVELVEVPATMRDGRVVTVQGTVRDVTGAQREEEALQHALDNEQRTADRLRQVDELRATFLAAVSHELRTPLAGLLGAAQTLVARTDRLTPDQAEELAEVVQRQSARLVGLLDDLLDVERLSRGQVQLTIEPTPLLPLAHRVAATLADTDGSRLVVDGDAGLVLDVDPTHVERILHNLVRNALKHTPASAEVRVLVEAHPGGGLLVVEDDGPGVPPSLWASLFDPFVQGPDAGASPSPGTGIGLALVSKFAELHGGRAWVEESASGGARFVVLLTHGCAAGATTTTTTDGRSADGAPAVAR